MFLSPLQVVAHMPVRPGMRVGDFGSGCGEYALLIAERLEGEGCVYAFDIRKENVESLSRGKSERYAESIYPLCCDLNQTLPLKDELLNTALLSNTLNAIQEKEHLLQEARRVLTQGGTILFIDWLSSFKNMGPRVEDVIPPTEAVRMFENAGFSVGGMLPAGTHHYGFIAKKL